MSGVPLSDLEGLAHRFAGERHDAFSSRSLARANEECVGRARPTIAPAVFSVDGTEFPTFYALLSEASPTFTTATLRLEPPPPVGPAWEFLRPLERIEFHADGSADVRPVPAGLPERAIARFLLREHYLPRSRSEEDRGAAGGSRVELGAFAGTLAEGLAVCRQRALLPFSAAVLLYFPEERVRYELDFVRSALLRDPRSGRLAPARRVRRTARVGWEVDRAVSRGDLPLFAARCLEVLSETNGLSALELAHVLGGVREIADSAIQGLVSRQLVTLDRRTGSYHVRFDALAPPAPGARPPVRSEPTPVANPALRTSVQELLAAADARASCPLCGAPLPPGPRGLLCDSCAAKVSGT